MSLARADVRHRTTCFSKLKVELRAEFKQASEHRGRWPKPGRTVPLDLGADVVLIEDVVGIDGCLDARPSSEPEGPRQLQVELVEAVLKQCAGLNQADRDGAVAHCAG